VEDKMIILERVKHKRRGEDSYTFFKYCERCGKRFSPGGRHYRFCNSCTYKAGGWKKK
jgi:rRNA maturation endonuclease Nob1